MKHAILFMAALLLYGLSLAQSKQEYSINGRIIDSSDDKIIAYSTVALCDTLSKPVNAVAADMNGKFTLNVKNPGEYTLRISYVGYAPYESNLTITETDYKTDLGTIRLTAGIEIEEVVVAVQKPLIKIDVDKLSYSVEADPESEYSSVAEIMRKIPQLSVDAEGNVLLNGQSSYKVLVNGKSSSMMSKNFKDVIKSMPANSVKDIEVITNPSTKYEADGAAGIINIITHDKKAIDGVTGSVGAGYSSLNDLNGNVYLSAQRGKFNFSVNYWAGSYHVPEYRSTTKETRYSDSGNTFGTTTSNGSGHNLYNSLGFEASYEIDTLNLLTVGMWGYSSGFQSHGYVETAYMDDNDMETERFRNDMNAENKSGSWSGNIDYQRSFRKPDKTFTVSYHLDNSPGGNELNYRLSGSRTGQTMSSNTVAQNEHTLQIDYYDPITKKHHIETGLKYILRLNTSDTEEFEMNNGEWIPIESKLYSLDYTQQIFGLYGGYLFKLEKFTAKTGLRAEGALNDSKATTHDEPVKFNYNAFNVVPYVNFSYQLKPSQTVRLSYTQRLRRPGIHHLNPYVQFEDNTDHVRYGNPNLRSVISHSFSANYSIFTSSSNLYVGLRYSMANNNIVNITRSEPNPDSNVRRLASTYFNAGLNREAGLNLSYNYRYNTRFNIYASGGIRYTYLSSDLSGISGEVVSEKIQNSGFSFNGNAGSSITLWKDAQININGGYFLQEVQLQGSGSAYYYTRFGLTQRFLKQKLSVNINASDPFNKYNVQESRLEQTGDFSMHTKSYSQSRRASINVSYRFGKMESGVKKARRGIKNDDVMSSGGSQGGSPGGD